MLGRHKRHFNPYILTLALNGSALTYGSAFKTDKCKENFDFEHSFIVSGKK